MCSPFTERSSIRPPPNNWSWKMKEKKEKETLVGCGRNQLIMTPKHEQSCGEGASGSVCFHLKFTPCRRQTFWNTKKRPLQWITPPPLSFSLSLSPCVWVMYTIPQTVFLGGSSELKLLSPSILKVWKFVFVRTSCTKAMPSCEKRKKETTIWTTVDASHDKEQVPKRIKSMLSITCMSGTTTNIQHKTLCPSLTLLRTAVLVCRLRTCWGICWSLAELVGRCRVRLPLNILCSFHRWLLVASKQKIWSAKMKTTSCPVTHSEPEKKKKEPQNKWRRSA